MSNNRNYRPPFRLSPLFVFLMAAVLWTLTRADEDASAVDKRAPQMYSFGLGKKSYDLSLEDPDRDKRAPQLYNFGLGKKSYDLPLEDSENPDEYLMGEQGVKRGDQRFSFGLGKRKEQGLGKRDKAGRYSFGLGKREPSRFAFGLGKREPNRFAFGLGKREITEDFDDYMKRRFSFGLGKRAADNRFSFGLGKRQDNRFSFGLGKRPDNRFSFGLGRRKRFATDDSDTYSEEDYTVSH